jgi:hypothetical protein
MIIDFAVFYFALLWSAAKERSNDSNGSKYRQEEDYGIEGKIIILNVSNWVRGKGRMALNGHRGEFYYRLPVSISRSPYKEF